MNIYNQVNSENYDDILKKAIKKAYKITKTKKKHVVNIILVSNEKIKQLNKDFRDKDSITDVLTFPSDEEKELGDIFIALHVAKEQARAYGHTLKRELAFLAIHGFLHTLGYDHETAQEEKTMFDLQRNILNALKIYR